MKFRSIFKTAVITSVILLCIGLAVSFFMKMSITEKAEDFNLYTLVPQNAVVIIDTNNMVDLLGQIGELSCSKDDHFLYASRLFSQLKEHINTLVAETPHGFSRQMNKTLISFHEPDNNYNQIYYCRLGAGDKELVENFVRNYCASSFPSKYFDYKGEEISIYPMEDDTFLACYITTEFLAVSYQKRLIEEVIDARINKASILTAPGFPDNVSATMSHIPAKVYLNMNSMNMGKGSDGFRPETSLGGWTEFTMKMNSDIIYFSGISYETDSVLNFNNMLRNQQQITGFPGENIPASSFYFDRRSVSDIQSTFDFSSEHKYVAATYSAYIQDRDRELMDFIYTYSAHSIISCMFQIADTTSLNPGMVVNIPMNQPYEAERFLRNLIRTIPHERDKEVPFGNTVYRSSTGGFYTFTVLPRNSFLPRITGVTESSLYSYFSFYKGNMLIAPDSRSLIAYIEAIESNDTLENSLTYEESMTGLSDSYIFMMMVDLGMVFEQPESYVRMIPNFFFRHSDFFKNFTLSTQYTCVNEVIYPNVVLLYKGQDLEVDTVLVSGDSIPTIN